MMISKQGEDAYFAASNSRNGFCSYYGACFDADRVRHVYAVKGGPGTGKSRFLREVAASGEAQGFRSEYIYCSSDPNSLDGVILCRGEDCVALLDATAPHVYEPSRPGVREEIVNLGAFWDRGVLKVYEKELEALSREKSEGYRRAYRYLSGVGEMVSVRDGLVAPYVRRGAIRSYAERLMQSIPAGGGYSYTPALIRSVGMEGEVGLDACFARAGRRILIQDCRGIAQYLMQALGELAVEKRLAVRISHDPICPNVIDGLLLVESGTAFVVGKAEELPEHDKTVVMRRFLETARMRGVREQIQYAERMRAAMLGGALDAMQAVKRVHFRMEEIYISAMDFAEKEKFTKIFCERLFHLQNG